MGFALALQLVLIFIQKKALAHKNKSKGKKIRNKKIRPCARKKK
jgi:hypothetical protein